MKPLSNLRSRLGRSLLGYNLNELRILTARRWRGKRDIRNIHAADFVLVSFAKSGRTWLRIMISRLFQMKHGLPESEILGFDNYHRKNAAIPKIFFTSGSYIKDASRLRPPETEFDRKKVIFLARHPLDIAVSYYFHVGNRVKAHKKDIKRLPDSMDGVSIYDFALNKNWGVPAIIDYLNEWAGNLARIEKTLVIRYEDMRARPADTLKEIAAFIDCRFEEAHYEEAVRFGAFETLKEKERANFFNNQKIAPRDPGNDASFKVRRGKVGGYRDYFTDAQIAELEAMVETRLSPLFGYGQQAGEIRRAG